MFFCSHGILSVILPLLAAKFATLQTRGKLGSVNFRKDFWDCYKGRETIDFASLVTIPETIAGHVSAPVPFSFLNANVAIFFFFTALCLPCFLCIFSRHTTGFLRTTRQTKLYRTRTDQTCNSLNDKRLGMGLISMRNQMVTSEIREQFHARFVQILIIWTKRK